MLLKALSRIAAARNTAAASRAAAARGAAGAAGASLILVASLLPAASVVLLASIGPAAAGARAPAQPPGRAAVAVAPARSVQVRNLHDAGPGSLRAAIATADASTPGITTEIRFAVAGTITLASSLPAVTRPVIIDARTAPGYHYNGPPVLEIDCNDWAGLRFAAGSAGAQLLGAAVDNASGNGVTLAAGSITLDGNYIGLNLAGHAFGNRGDGVYAGPGSSGNTIGRNPTGVSGAVANVISGNAWDGLVLAGSSRNTVAANRIGTSPAGLSAIPNGGNGIWVTAGIQQERDRRERLRQQRHRAGQQPNRLQGDGAPGVRGPPAGQPDIRQRGQRRADRPQVP